MAMIRLSIAASEWDDYRALRADLRADAKRARQSPAVRLLADHGLSAPLGRDGRLARGVDPRAFLAAAQFLAAQPEMYRSGERIAPGPRVAGTDQHGGWDAEGHHGVRADQVARAWFLAGCRATAKFFLLLSDAPEGRTSGMFSRARKGDTLLDLLRMRRALRRHWAWGVQFDRGRLDERNVGNDDVIGSRKVLMALGRLSAPLHRAALLALAGQPLPTRVRDLPWQAVADAQRMLSADRSGRVRAALTGDRGVAALLGLHSRAADYELAAALCPAYPSVTLAQARRIAMGARPVDLAGGELTAAEAHQWLRDDPTAAPGMFGARVALGRWEIRDRHGVEIVFRERRVAEWMCHRCERDGAEAVQAALDTEYVAHGPAGEQRTWTPFDMLDLITAADVGSLREGVRTVVMRTLARIDAERLAEHLRADTEQRRPLCAAPRWAQRLPRSVRLLQSTTELLAEGTALGHCVGGYSSAVASGRCLILSVRSRHGRSTVEMSPDGARIYQHRGQRNGEPPRRHHQLISAMVARIQRTAS